jgi:hypothetical protein
MEKYFKLNRFIQFSKLDLINNIRFSMLAMLGIGGAAILFSFFSMLGGNAGDFHNWFYNFILFGGGLVFTSMTFKEFYQPPKGYSMLMIPASSFEKFTSKYLITTIFYILVTMVSYYFISVISEAINGMIFKKSHPLFNPFKYDWKLFVGFFSAHALFFHGAIFYKSYHFIKTAVVWILFSIFIGLIAYGMIRILFSEFFQGMDYVKGMNHRMLSLYFERYNEILNSYMKIVGHIIPPVFIIISYLRLRETEV